MIRESKHAKDKFRLGMRSLENQFQIYEDDMMINGDQSKTR